MSEENLDSLRRAMDAFNRRDKAAWLAECDPECENVPPKEWPENAPLHGAEAIWDFYVEAIDAWDDAEFQFVELLDAGTDMVVVNQVGALRGKTSGAGVLWSYWVLFSLRDGKVIRSEWFADREEAFETARLREGLTNT